MNQAVCTESAEQKQPESIGVLFGSFNPPHGGHIDAAVQAHEAGVKTVFMIPAKQSYAKRKIPQAAYHHKVALCKILAEKYSSWLKVKPALEQQPIKPVGNLTSYFNAVSGFVKDHPDQKIVLISGDDTKEKIKHISFLFNTIMTLKTLVSANFRDVFNAEGRKGFVKEVIRSMSLTTVLNTARPMTGNHDIAGVSSSKIRKDLESGKQGFYNSKAEAYIRENHIY